MLALSLDDRLRAALAEDIGRGDATTLSTVPANATAKSEVLLKQAGRLSGLAVFGRVFELLDPTIRLDWQVSAGQELAKGTLAGTLTGNAHYLLQGERVALNLLQRLSGIATLTSQYVAALAGSQTQLLDTRKTTPLWRDLEKQAVLDGGGLNHRMGLDDGILIKDNHIVAAGGVRAAIQRAKQRGYLLKVLCEVSDLEQLHEAIEASADRIMLDNFDTELLEEAVGIRNRLAPQISLEASGNMTPERLPKVAATGVDFVSAGALTHSAPALDISLNFV